LGSVSCVKRFTTGSKKLSQGPSKVTDNARLGAEVAETTVKRHLCCGFRRTGKAMGQVYQCWWRICREINAFFFQVRISHVLRFMSIFYPLTDSLAYISQYRSELDQNSGSIHEICTPTWSDRRITLYDLPGISKYREIRRISHRSVKSFKKSATEHNLITTDLQVKRIQTYSHSYIVSYKAQIFFITFLMTFALHNECQRLVTVYAPQQVYWKC
jgi:hypothetical protein